VPGRFQSMCSCPAQAALLKDLPDCHATPSRLESQHLQRHIEQPSKSAIQRKTVLTRKLAERLHVHLDTFKHQRSWLLIQTPPELVSIVQDFLRHSTEDNCNKATKKRSDCTKNNTTVNSPTLHSKVKIDIHNLQTWLSVFPELRVFWTGNLISSVPQPANIWFMGKARKINSLCI